MVVVRSAARIAAFSFWFLTLVGVEAVEGWPGLGTYARGVIR